MANQRKTLKATIFWIYF